jgi:phage terminase large subunit-like protein
MGGGGDVQQRESVLSFKSYEKGREKWQGETLAGVWFDEEPPLDVVARNGIVIITFTPLLGMSDVGQIIVRKLDDAIIKQLKQRAKKQGISLEEAVRRALEDAVKPTKKELLEELKRIRAMSPPITEPPFSQDLIREDRDSR